MLARQGLNFWNCIRVKLSWSCLHPMWPAINIPTIVTGRLLSLQNFISLVPILVDIVSQFVQVCNNKKFSIINEYQVPWNIYKYNYWRKKNAQMILASYKRYSSMDQSTAESSKALTLKILLNFQLGKDCNITMYLKVKSIVIFPNWVAYMFKKSSHSLQNTKISQLSCCIV